MNFTGGLVLAFLFIGTEALCLQVAENFAWNFKRTKESFNSINVQLGFSQTSMQQKRILSITGDFNGDGEVETLSEYYFDPITQKRIDSIPSGGDHEWIANHETMTYLTCSDTRINSLKVTPGNDWGILSLINLGDVNQDSVDDVSIVLDNADFSSISSCSIYSYCSGTWKRLFSFSIHEEAFWYPDGFDTQIFYNQIPGYLEKKGDTWTYYNYDGFWGDGNYLDEKGYPVLHALRIRKKCSCLSN